jgi:hypothetical protein
MHHLTESPDAALAEQLAAYSNKVQELASRLADMLTDDEMELLGQLIGALDDDVCATLDREEARRWRSLVAHLPGLAPVLEILRSHAAGQSGPCSLADGGACSLPREI